MRVALFASGPVGRLTAEFLHARGDRPECLVLDERDPGGENARIAVGSGVHDDHILYTNRQTKGTLAESVRPFNPDLAIFAWWPYIADRHLLRVPRIGTLNFHPSLLPNGRGKAPNFWTIVEETPFGVTIHWVDEGIDEGDLAFQREIAVDWHDTGASLYEKSLDAMVELFQESWPRIKSGRIPRMPQTGPVKYHAQRELEPASNIDLDRSYTGRELLNILRARTFHPHPGAWFLDGGQRYEVRVSITSDKDCQHESRTIRCA